MNPIFVSFGFSNGRLEGLPHVDVTAVFEAIRGLVAVAGKDRPIMMKWDLAATPFAWEVAHNLGVIENLVAYASEIDRPEINRLSGTLMFRRSWRWMTIVAQRDARGRIDEAQSRDRQRHEMIVHRPIPNHPTSRFDVYAAAVFLGGTYTDVDADYSIFTQQPTLLNVKRIPVGSTGGMAQHLTQRSTQYTGTEIDRLNQALAYRALFRDLLQGLP